MEWGRDAATNRVNAVEIDFISGLVKGEFEIHEFYVKKENVGWDKGTKDEERRVMRLLMRHHHVIYKAFRTLLNSECVTG